MPGLKKAKKEQDRPRVRFFEGQKALEKLLMEPVKQRVDEILILVQYENFFNFFPEELAILFKKERIKRKIHLRILRNPKKEFLKDDKENDKKDLRTKRILPSGFEPESSFFIFDGQVAIFNTVGQPFGILIKSKAFYNTQKAIFNQLWKVSKKCKDSEY